MTYSFLVIIQMYALTSSCQGNTNKFLAWVKMMVRKRFPVTIGVYVNGGELDEYDHIVTVVAFQVSVPVVFLVLGLNFRVSISDM